MQAMVNDGKRGHLLGYEQHPPAPDDVIGYNVGNGLRFTRAGRPVKNKTLGKAVVYGAVLRRIGRYGQIHAFLGRIGLVAAAFGQIEGVGRQFELVVDKRIDNRVFPEPVRTVFDVVPELVIRKRQTRQKDVAQNFPTLKADYFPFQPCYYGHYGLLRIGLHGGKPSDIEVKLLIQKFKQSTVQADIVDVDVKRVNGGGYAFFCHGYGIQQKRRVFFFGVFVFLPF